MWRASWRTIARFRSVSIALVLGCWLGSDAGAGAATPGPAPALETILANYLSAVDDPGAAAFDRLESNGTLNGAGLTGTFHTWISGANERDDQSLGPRGESIVQRGDDVYFSDSNGSVRKFGGLMLRRVRTERFIDSGDFARNPKRSTLRGESVVDGRKAYVLDVAPEGGETETVYLDTLTWLPLQIAYDDDDGRTTIDLGDWRSVRGHRFPFRSVESDGDHPFDTTQTTAQVTLDGTIDPAVFAPPVARPIEMSAPQTIALERRGGHLYAPVRIGGKTYQFLIDTGAQDVLLDARIVRDLGLESEGSLQASGATRLGGLKLVRLPELEVGSGKMRDLVVSSLDLGSATGGALRIDGILGYPFFAAATVQIDPVAATMTFGPPGSIVSNGIRVPIETDRAFPEAHVRLNGGVDALFIIDTGDAASMLLYDPFYQTHRSIATLSDRERRSFGIGGSTASLEASVDAVELGGISLYHVDTSIMRSKQGAFADRFDAGNVGLGLLQNFIVTFDESRNAMYLQKSSAFDDGRLNR